MDPKRATILCIDDEEPGLQVRRMLLESAGYRVICARSGAEGIKLFQSQPADAIVLDYWMSGMNGIAVAREIKRISPGTPIMILSAYGTLLDETLGLADVWLRKGEEEPQYILNKLQELLENRNAKQLHVAPPAASQ
ncbi:MAG: response regulator [Acidobacteria bacterium]|nr:response regulator [Acidobacteriota bacterium]